MSSQQLVLHQPLRHDRIAQQVTYNVWDAASQIPDCLSIVQPWNALPHKSATHQADSQGSSEGVLSHHALEVGNKSMVTRDLQKAKPQRWDR